MRILITGGAGFVGSHIQDKYIGAGHGVTVLDNLSTGKREYLNPKSEFIEGDITDANLVREICKQGKFDVINHHAAQINVRSSFDDPVHDCHVNVIGTLQILKAVIDFKIPRIIFASTGGAIYGSPGKLPADENTPLMPESPYAISKMTSENYIRNLSDLYGIDYVIFRYANVYGPRQIAKGEAGVVAIFTEKILAGKPPVIFGSGEHTRDYVFVDDVARANLMALDRSGHAIFNIGCGIERNVHEVYAAVAKAFGGRALRAQYGPEVPEVERISLDATLAKKELGWTPAVDFTTGVSTTIKSFGIG